KDHIDALLGPISAGGRLDAELEARGKELHALLRMLTEVDAPARESSKVTGNTAVARAPATGEDWHVCVRFGAGVLPSRTAPLGFCRSLQTFCEIRELKVLDDRLPSPAEMDPESCYLGFEMDLRTGSGKASIESAFEFVREDCTLSVTPLAVAAPARDAQDD